MDFCCHATEKFLPEKYDFVNKCPFSNVNKDSAILAYLRNIIQTRRIVPIFGRDQQKYEPKWKKMANFVALAPYLLPIIWE